MNYHIHITKRAEQDLDEAAGYIRFTLLNPNAALNLLVKARKVINPLESHPERNPLVDDPVLSSWGIRFANVNNYLAFYILSENEHTVHIIRFLYGKRNWKHILKEQAGGAAED